MRRGSSESRLAHPPGASRRVLDPEPVVRRSLREDLARARNPLARLRQNGAVARRSYGTGLALRRHRRRRARDLVRPLVTSAAAGQAQLGPKRAPGTREGLTRAQAEERAQRSDRDRARGRRGPTSPLRRPARAASTTSRRWGGSRRRSANTARCSARTSTRIFGDAPWSGSTPDDVERFIATMRRGGSAPRRSSTRSSSCTRIFAFGERRAGVGRTPGETSTAPRARRAPTSASSSSRSSRRCCARAATIRSGPTERALYLTAAMTGLRQGELLGLRWRDVDWAAGAIRVRQNYVRGEFGTPKSRRARARCRWPIASPASSSATSSARRTRPTTIWSSATRRPARPSTTPSSLKRFKTALGRAARPRGPLPRPPPHVRHPHGRRRRPAPHPPGVDGPPRLQDHPDLRRLRPHRHTRARWSSARSPVDLFVDSKRAKLSELRRREMA